MNISDWKDIAVLALTAAGVILSWLTSVLWSSIKEVSKDLSEFQKIAAEKYQRRDDTAQLEQRIMDAIGEVRDLLHQILQNKS